MSDIFISYNHKDQKKAFKIADTLSKKGLNIFIDRDLTYTQFVQELEEEIDNCKIFLLIASENAYNSDFVKDECKYAKDNKKDIIPYIIDNSKPNKGFGVMLSNYTQYNSSKHSINFLSSKIKEILSLSMPVFISYNHKDQEKAFEIADALSKKGLNIFIDRDLTHTHFTKELVDKINACKIFLLIASENAYNSDFVKDECKYAKDNKKDIIPYIIDNSKPHKGFGLMLSNYIQYNSSEHSINFLSSKIKEILIPPEGGGESLNLIKWGIAILIPIVLLFTIFNGLKKDKQQETFDFISQNPDKIESIVSSEQQVDLGLSVYWSGFNIGAKEPSEIGKRFYWGEIESASKSYIKREIDIFNHDSIINENPETDAARKLWGDNWRIPSVADFENLRQKCKIVRNIMYKNCSGSIFIGINGNCIFIPDHIDASDGTHVHYSTNKASIPITGEQTCSIYNVYGEKLDIGFKDYPYSIRPVKDKE